MRLLLIVLALFTLPAVAAGSDDLEPYFLFMGFELEETELSEIQDALGVAPTHQEGDAAYSYTAICYRVPGDKISVYFESGEMGGGRRLLSYRVVAEEKPDFECGDTSNEIINSYNIGVLEMGSAVDQTIASLPGEIESREGNDFYYYKKIK